MASLIGLVPASTAAQASSAGVTFPPAAAAAAMTLAASLSPSTESPRLVSAGTTPAAAIWVWYFSDRISSIQSTAWS